MVKRVGVNSERIGRIEEPSEQAPHLAHVWETGLTLHSAEDVECAPHDRHEHRVHATNHERQPPSRCSRLDPFFRRTRMIGVTRRRRREHDDEVFSWEISDVHCDEAGNAQGRTNPIWRRAMPCYVQMMTWPTLYPALREGTVSRLDSPAVTAQSEDARQIRTSAIENRDTRGERPQLLRTIRIADSFSVRN